MATPTPQMPRLRDARGMQGVSEAAEPAPLPSLDDKGGYVVLTDEAYDAVVGMTTAPTADPCDLGVATVEGQYIVLRQSFPLSDWRRFQNLFGQEGEILLTEPAATLQHVLALRRYGLKVVKYSAAEVLAKAEGVDLRWTPEAGAEIVAQLATAQDSLRQVGILSVATSCGEYWRQGCTCSRCQGGILTTPAVEEPAKRPVLNLSGKESNAERFTLLAKHLVALHVWATGIGERKGDNVTFPALEVPARFDRAGWEKKEASLERWAECLSEMHRIISENSTLFSLATGSGWDNFTFTVNLTGAVVYSAGYDLKKTLADILGEKDPPPAFPLPAVLTAVRKELRRTREHLAFLDARRGQKGGEDDAP